jgi:NAD(P)-dependent dehydrogenase (short-subunit alcohol dehydrogenase family)
VTYSVIKTGLIGLTRYLATYWGDHGVRANVLCLGGVARDQSPTFVQLVSERIPLGRMASPDEYGDAMVFLCSDASSYMTGACLVLDGGRTAW